MVFVPFTIAGERWNVRLEKVNKTVAWGGEWSCCGRRRSGWNPVALFSADAVAASSDT